MLKFHVVSMKYTYVNLALAFGIAAKLLYFKGMNKPKPTLAFIVLFFLTQVQQAATALSIALSLFVTVKVDQLVSWKWAAILWCFEA